MMDRVRPVLHKALRRLGLPVPGGRAELAPAPPRERPRLADAPLDVLAAKVVFSHLRNRQQKLGPPPTAFGHLDAPQTELLVRAMVAAVAAKGPIGEADERALRAAVSAFGLQPAAHGFVADAVARPAPLEMLLRQVRDPHLASMFYAASLAAVDKHNEVNRAYLGYLAARLRLPQDTLERLHSQFGFGAAAG